MKQLLIINDLCGYSTVATTAMMPILSYMGIPTFNLPTAIVSNNLEYGKFAILDTTDYICQTFPVWKDLGFHYEAIATGFMASERQAEIIADYCREQAVTGTSVFVDPIMGDEGKLYNGITEATVLAMRKMISVAHLCFPNYTEACYLTDTPYHPEGITRDEAYSLMDKLRDIGAHSVLITSIPVDGKMSVVGYKAPSTIPQGEEPLNSSAPDIPNTLTSEDTHCTNAINVTSPWGRKGGAFLLTYDEIPVRIPGTGDIFSAIVIGNLLHGEDLKTSTRRAMDHVRTLIDINKDNKDKIRGIPLERYLHVLDE